MNMPAHTHASPCVPLCQPPWVCGQQGDMEPSLGFTWRLINTSSPIIRLCGGDPSPQNHKLHSPPERGWGRPGGGGLYTMYRLGMGHCAICLCQGLDSPGTWPWAVPSPW